jgi:uncharacterized protein (DUF58 family)
VNLRRLLVVAGVVLFGLGVLELFELRPVPFPASETLLTLLGAVAVLYGGSALLEQRREGSGPAETPDVELATPPEIPGTDLGATLEGIPGVEAVRSEAVPSVRGELRKAATAFLTQYRGLDSETAWEQVTAGTWTEDSYATGFLTGEGVSFRQRARTLVRADGATSRDRAVDAVAEIAGVEPDESADSADVALSSDIDETGTDSLTPGSIDGQHRSSRHRTNHWTGVSVVVLVCLGAGVILREPGVLLAGVVAVGYAAYARATPPGTVALSATRSVDATDPEPGDEVTVTVTLTNEGGFCPDLRVVDGVPESLTVADGSPRSATALRAGESVTLSYTVTVRPGVHEFGPALVLARNLSNSVEQEFLLPAPATLAAVHRPEPVEEPVPLRHQPTQYAGRAPTDTGGEGIEFHTVREYQPGDSMTRIDWNRRARTGELTTLEFRRERATRVMLLVDIRPEAHVGHSPRSQDAVERSVEAAQRILPALLAAGHLVGVGAFGPQDCFLAPDTGTSHRQQGRQLLATDPAFGARTDPEHDQRYWLRRLRKRLPGDTQLLVFSPLLDTRAVQVVRRLEAYGHPVTVLSPDVTTSATSSRRLMRARRRLMMTDLRQTGVPVLDWSPGTRLEELFRRERATR